MNNLAICAGRQPAPERPDGSPGARPPAHRPARCARSSTAERLPGGQVCGAYGQEARPVGEDGRVGHPHRGRGCHPYGAAGGGAERQAVRTLLAEAQGLGVRRTFPVHR
jgi:hypothetical protein